MLCLEDVVVLDLARRYPAAFTSMYLADFGAEVIKIDAPGSYEKTPQGIAEEERMAAFWSLDRNKRSIELDLKSEGGREVFYRLARRADVLVDGFRPGVMDRLGVGWARLGEMNPRLIYCALSGFGQDGPYAADPAHDANFLALGGVLSLIGERDGSPCLPSNIIADYAGAAAHGVIGVLLALIARQKTGKGQFVDVAYLDTVISLITADVSQYFMSGVVPKRGETWYNGGAPWTQVFRCKDGEYFTIAAGEPHHWANLCRALAREDLIPDQIPSRERADEVIAELAAIFATRTRDQWWQYLRDRQVCVGPVYTVNETVEDPQVIHRQMVVEHAHPTLGQVKQTGIPIKLSDTPGRIRHVGVPTGADTDAVLRELGYSLHEIARFRKAGVFGKVDR